MNPEPAKDNKPKNTSQPEPAVDIARAKLDKLYESEPTAKEELEEAEQQNTYYSKHQAYMLNLSKSGKSLAEIQTAWHQYYLGLPDNEKHKVWQEFYAEHAKKRTESTPSVIAKPEVLGSKPKINAENVAEVKKRILKSAENKPKHSYRRQNLHSVVFGLGMGSLVMFILLFGFFNERFIAPFITPSRTVSSTPIIVDPTSTAAGPESEVIIPKINVEIPTVYNVPYNSNPEKFEEGIQNGLEGGVVHYSITPDPGQQGNSVFVGHSSNNIFNKGKYKFAFVLLNKLEKGDTFYLTKNGIRYSYKVFEKKIVSPTDVSVLKSSAKTATATLITCDPPGTSINRLVVVGEQISPDPVGNKPSTATGTNASEPAIVPGNAESLWQRIKKLVF